MTSVAPDRSICLLFVYGVTYVSLIQQAEGHRSSLVLNVHDASSVIAFGTSAPCHFSATNVTELWPNPDILYSAPSLIWLQWYHIWADLIRGLQGQQLCLSVCTCNACDHVLLVHQLVSTPVYVHAWWSNHVCTMCVSMCCNKLQSTWQVDELN